MVKDVYFLTVHLPYEEPGAPAPVNVLVVHAATLLHRRLPQPDAARMYRCLTEFPGRSPGCLVPLSQLNHELDAGRLWSEVADWPAVIHTLIPLSRAGTWFESIPMVLAAEKAQLLAAAPGQPVHLISPAGVTVLGDRDRDQVITDLALSLPTASGDRPLWPGDDLITPPSDPAEMPYHPHRG